MSPKWPLVIDGRGFAIDSTAEGFSGPSSVPLLRAQADTGGRPGEGSLNREDFWRRTMISWHHGAGQKVYDREGSDPFRFQDSHGIDPWTEGEISLLPDVIALTHPAFPAVTAQPGKLLVVPDSQGVWLYHLFEGTLYEFFSYAFNPSPGYPSTTVSGTDWATYDISGENITDIATDGQWLYLATGHGIHRFEVGVSSAISAVWNTVDVDKVWFVNNRLIAAKGPAVYNVLSGTPPVAPIYTHPHANWTWTAAAGAGSFIYLSGATLDEVERTYASQVYKTSVTTSDTAELDAPVIATQLPDGESVQTIYGYAGYLFMGSDKGVRMAQPDSNGFLSYGALIPLGLCTAFEGEENFVWVGASDEDETVAHTFLWRLDLRSFTSPLVPAYARDLESPVIQEKSRWIRVHVASIATFEGRRIWTQYGSNDGISPGMTTTYGEILLESDEKVVEGHLNTGRITFDLTEPKVPVEFVVNHKPLPGPGVPVASQIDFVGTFDYDEGGQASYQTTLIEGSTVSRFDGAGVDLLVSPYTNIILDLYMRRDGGEPTVAPVVTAVTVKARPAPARSNTYVIPILIQPVIEDLGRQRTSRDFVADFEYLMAYAESGARAEVALLGRQFVGYVEDYQFIPHGMERWDRNFKGTLTIKIREVI